MAETTEAVPAVKDNSGKLHIDQLIASEKLCASLSIPAGARVLDIGFGHSALHAALGAARRRAKVTATHVNEAVIERARNRADAELIDGVEFMRADAATLPFADGSFDFVLSTLGVVFLPDQEAAAKEVARVLRPGGVLGLTAFTRQSLPSQVYMLSMRVLNPPMPARHHYEWADGARAGELLTPYFHGVRVEQDSYDSCFASPAVAFDVTADWNPNIRRMKEQAPAEKFNQMRDGFIEIADSINRATDGTYMGRTDYAVISGVRA